MAKWKDISDLVYTDLSSYTALTALLSNGVHSIYPLIADAEEGDKFLTYHTEYQGKPSKDGVYDFNIVINAYAETYNQAIEIADAVSDAIEAASTIYTIKGGQPLFNEQGEFFIQQTFNTKQ